MRLTLVVCLFALAGTATAQSVALPGNGVARNSFPQPTRADFETLLERGRSAPGVKASILTMRSHPIFREIGVNPFTQILIQADVIGLSVDAADSIAFLSRRQILAQDSIWAGTFSYLAALPDVFDRDSVWARVTSAFVSATDRTLANARRVRRLLTDEQWQKLPSTAKQYLDSNCVRASIPGNPFKVPIGGAGAAGIGIPMGCSR